MIKLHRGCIDCGYAEHAVALQFDHVNDDKKMNVSDMIRSDYSWVTIKEEIDKCEVRCSNCHAVKTAERKLMLMMRERAMAEMPTLVYGEHTDGTPDDHVAYPEWDVDYWVEFTEPVVR